MVYLTSGISQSSWPRSLVSPLSSRSYCVWLGSFTYSVVVDYLQVANQVIFLDDSHEARVAFGGQQIGQIMRELMQLEVPPFIPSEPSKDAKVEFHIKERPNARRPPPRLFGAESQGEVDAPLYFLLTKGIRKTVLALWLALISLHAISERTAGKHSIPNDLQSLFPSAHIF